MQGKFRYWVSYFCELNLSNNDMGISLNGHFEEKVYEITHPLSTETEVKRFVEYIQQKEGKMWVVHLLAFSLMYFEADKG